MASREGRAQKIEVSTYSKNGILFYYRLGKFEPDISEKDVAGVLITLLENPFPNTSQDTFNKMAETFENNYAVLGKMFIEKM